MSEQKHTPRPWTTGRGNEIWAKRGPVAMTVARAEDDGSEEEANARLIAAAPDLLEQLQTVLARLDLEPVASQFPCSAMREDIRAAIAKATA